MNYLRLAFIIQVLISSVPSQAKGRLDVLTFNIGALVPYSNSTLKRLEIFCQDHMNENHDVILFQEVWIDSYRQYLKDNCGLKYSLDLNEEDGYLKKSGNDSQNLSYYLFKYIIPKNLKVDNGLLILSKYPLEKEKRLVFEANGDSRNILDGEYIVRKGAIGATLKHPMFGDVFIANTHLVSNYLDHNYDEQRKSQLMQLKNWFKINSRSRPAIIGGDFNISAPLENRSELVTTHNLWDILKNAYFKNYSTFKFNLSKDTTFPGRNKNENEGIVDHIFGHNGLMSFSGQIFDQQNISDHNALFVSFNFKK